MLVDFASCSYLGLGQNKIVTEPLSAETTLLGNFPISRTRLILDIEYELNELLGNIFCDYFNSIIFTSF